MYFDKPCFDGWPKVELAKTPKHCSQGEDHQLGLDGQLHFVHVLIIIWAVVDQTLLHADLALDCVQELTPIKVVPDWPDEKNVEAEGSDEQEDKTVEQLDAFSAHNSAGIAHIDEPWKKLLNIK